MVTLVGAARHGGLLSIIASMPTIATKLAIPILLALLGWLAGCASVGSRAAFDSAHIASQNDAARECAQWFQRLDAAIDRAGVRDGGEARVAGFPYLRTNRFLAAFQEPASSDAAVRSTWLRSMRALDHDARQAEISNLPGESLAALGTSADQLRAKTGTCAVTLATADEATIAARSPDASVPDDYSDAKRVFGLYALARFPFFRGVSTWQESAQKAFTEAPSSTIAVTRYTPAITPGTLLDRARAAYANATRDALGVPALNSGEWDQLFEAHAPGIEVETTGDYDRIGALMWANGFTPSVDTATPTVYRRLSFTRIGGETFAQLNYSFWFPARPTDGVFDVLAGALDGLILRVTLDRQGEPILYDSIHACGCYHLFFPTARVRAKPAPSSHIEWAFMPAAAPVPGAGERLVWRLASRSHYITQLYAAPLRNDLPYRWQDDRTLRTLPRGSGTRSAFAEDGIIAGTERKERWLFWPMGIASPGAMRQWGRHATAFVGRRHFDDADLIDKRFEIVNDR
jgi:hypothetical protein